MQAPIHPPQCEELLGPLLASLPAASISAQPPTVLLPLLSPILRQRVQLLSESASDPWLPLLSYDTANASKLESIVKNERFEPHPVSGEVEIDWESEVGVQYRRVDEETLQALVRLTELGLAIKLVYCENDGGVGGSGWRIGEALAAEAANVSWGQHSVGEAESAFFHSKTSTRPPNGKLTTPDPGEEEEDDDYWAQYDNTPAQTPGPNDTHDPPSNTNGRGGDGTADEDSYYAQYSTVQPAMDNHDPDEAQTNGHVESSLGKDEITTLHARLSHPELHDTSEAWSNDSPFLDASNLSAQATGGNDFVAHPRPTSSHGSSGSDTVARLEKAAAEEAGIRETSEIGIKQHIGTSIKSLWRLAKVVGMDREEFERIVTTELECIGMMDEDSI